MVLILLFFAPLLLLSSGALAQERLLVHEYGEKNFDIYYGAIDPDFIKEPGLGLIRFKSDLRRDNQFLHSAQGELIEIKAYLEELKTAKLCPNFELAENLEHMRYLYRLSAISYLDEHLKLIGEVAKKMKLGEVCAPKIQKLLKDCRPKSDDMKLFVKSAKVLSKNFTQYLPAYDFNSDKFREQWNKDFANSSQEDSVKARIRNVCRAKDCSKLSKKKLKDMFGKICGEDSKKFVQICSEEDSLYGLSRASEAFYAISSSDAIKVINENGNGRGCLARFSRLMSARELRMPSLEALMSGVYESLKRRGDSLGGRLFPAGSLRQFIEGGLADIFVEAKKEAKKGEGKKIVETVALAPLAPEPIKRILQPKPKLPEVKAKPKPKDKPKALAKSHFLKTAEAAKEFGLESVKVNMLQFKYDYIFNSKMIRFLDEQMENYFSRAGLEEMKHYDSLGSKKGPVPLLFVKYLIDKKQHQGLNNLIEVLGESFFIKNNIDDPSIAFEVDYVSLKFDQTVDPPWQLYIEKAPSTSKRE